MPRNRTATHAAAIAAVLALAGCGGVASSTSAGPSTSATLAGSPTPATTATTGIQSPGAASLGPTATFVFPTLAPAGTQCTGIPVYANPTAGATYAPAPSLIPDPTLFSRLPTTMGGQPVISAAANWVNLLCNQYGQQYVDAMAQPLSAMGLDIEKISIATFQSTIGEQVLAGTAFRTIGQDPNAIVQNFSKFAELFGNTATAAASLSHANVGGKDVTVATGSDEYTTYLYVAGDTLFVVDTQDQAEAATIFSAIP